MKTFSEIRIVFTTASTREDAHEIAMVMLQENLASCVTIIPNVTSYFVWKGELDISTEFMLKLKTFESKLGAIEKRIKELTKYELPEILVLKDIDSSEEYFEWMQSRLIY